MIPIFLNISKLTKSITIYCHNSQCFQIQFHDSIFINITLGKYVEVIYVLVHFNGCPISFEKSKITKKKGFSIGS
jgi:hypothetical protein